MTDLSPAALAVWEAFNSEEPGVFVDYGDNLAAALRAVADQAHPKAHIEDIDYVHQGYVDGWKDALDVILVIADDLEAQ